MSVILKCVPKVVMHDWFCQIYPIRSILQRRSLVRGNADFLVVRLIVLKWDNLTTLYPCRKLLKWFICSSSSTAPSFPSN